MLITDSHSWSGKVARSLKLARSSDVPVCVQEMDWRFLRAAAGFLGVGLRFLQERAELWLQAVGAGVALALVWTLTR